MNILSFIIYCIVVTFTPGPTNIVILSSVQHHGARKTMGYVGGATLAFGLLLTASALLNRLLAFSNIHWTAAFRPRTGMGSCCLTRSSSPYQFFLNCKVEHAKQFIEKNRDIYSAVAEFGFTDLTHLNRHFKSVYGITAYEYRRHLQN